MTYYHHWFCCCCCCVVKTAIVILFLQPYTLGVQTHGISSAYENSHLFTLRDVYQQQNINSISRSYQQVRNIHQIYNPCSNKKDTTEVLSEDGLSILLKSTELFTTTGKNILIITTEEEWKVLQTIQNCNFTLRSAYQIWQINPTFDMKYLTTEVRRWRYINLKEYIVYCSVNCIAMIFDALLLCDVCKEDDFTWFVSFPELLYIGIKLPNNVISIDARLPCKDNITEPLRSITLKNHTYYKQLYTIYIYALKGTEWKQYAIMNQNGTIQLSYNYLTILQDYPLHGRYRKQLPYKVVTIIEPPYTMIHEQSSSMYNPVDGTCEVGRVCWNYEVSNNTKIMKPYCCIGFLIELLSVLEEDIEFASNIYIVEDGKYGEIKDGEWVGLVGDLVRKKADIILASLNINEKRADVIDFTLPFLVGGLSLISLLRNEPVPFVNSEPFKSLTPLMWLVTIMITVVASLGIFFIEKTVHQEKYAWLEAITYLVALIFQKDLGGKNPISLSARTISVTVAASTLVIMSTYTAVLTANYVSHESSLPITGYNDPKITNPTTAFKYGTLANSAYSQMFRDSADPVWNRMHKFMKKYDFTDTDLAFQKLARGELNAIIQDYYIAYHYIAKDPECKFKYIGKPIKDGGGGLAVQKGSDLQDKVSHYINKYQSLDLLTIWHKRWLVTKCMDSKDNNIGSVDSKGINYFGGIVLFLVGAICLSGALLLLEIFVSRCMNDIRTSPPIDTSLRLLDR